MELSIKHGRYVVAISNNDIMTTRNWPKWSTGFKRGDYR